jgi:prepilin-type N-terminal cleavage/methylation domain-containing protein
MKKDGFTLMELMIVVAISAAVTTAAFVYLGNYRMEQNLKLTASELQAAVKNTQNLSKSQQDGKKWGVRFSNAVSNYSYEVFSGANYSTSSVSKTYSLGRRIQFGNPATSTIDVSFGGITGYPSQNQVISLITGRGDGFVNDISVNSLGQIISRFDTGVAGYWHFDEGTGTTTYDSSGMGNNGTLINSPAWSSGSNCKSGACLFFDNTAQKYVNVPDNTATDIRTDLTLSAWVYPTGAGGSDSFGTVIVTLGSGFYLSFNDSANAISCYWYGKTPAGYHTTSNNTVPLNRWTHISCAWDDSNLYQYINGYLSKTTATTGAGTGSAQLIIGAENATRNFQGYIDEVRVYNRTLSATEISDIYNSTR